MLHWRAEIAARRQTSGDCKLEFEHEDNVELDYCDSHFKERKATGRLQSLCFKPAHLCNLETVDRGT